VRAVQITRFGGPEVLDVVDVPDPTTGNGQKLYDVPRASTMRAPTTPS
jgi:NADPH:quinone reductase-like Zn-dependent oxidoreductase